VERLREAVATMERALRLLETDATVARRAEIARHAMELSRAADALPSPALHRATQRAATSARALAELPYRTPTPDEVARVAAQLDAVRLGCDMLDEQLRDALRTMLEESLRPSADSPPDD
jgi:hypothetical protein